VFGVDEVTPLREGETKEVNVREWVGLVGSEGREWPQQRFLPASIAMTVVVGIRSVEGQCGRPRGRERVARVVSALWGYRITMGPASAVLGWRRAQNRGGEVVVG
jgi:hypothetical protein